MPAPKLYRHEKNSATIKLNAKSASYMNFAQANGISIENIAANRPICMACDAAIKQAGVKAVSPIKKALK